MESHVSVILLLHIHGNTLDLLCVNDTSIVCSTKVITPGLSDHSIITAEVKYGSFTNQDEHIADRCEIRIHRKADDIKFRKLMSDTYDKLVQMSRICGVISLKILDML